MKQTPFLKNRKVKLRFFLGIGMVVLHVRAFAPFSFANNKSCSSEEYLLKTNYSKEIPNQKNLGVCYAYSLKALLEQEIASITGELSVLQIALESSTFSKQENLWSSALGVSKGEYFFEGGVVCERFEKIKTQGQGLCFKKDIPMEIKVKDRQSYETEALACKTSTQPVLSNIESVEFLQLEIMKGGIQKSEITQSDLTSLWIKEPCKDKRISIPKNLECKTVSVEKNNPFTGVKNKNISKNSNLANLIEQKIKSGKAVSASVCTKFYSLKGDAFEADDIALSVSCDPQFKLSSSFQEMQNMEGDLHAVPLVGVRNIWNSKSNLCERQFLVQNSIGKGCSEYGGFFIRNNLCLSEKGQVWLPENVLIDASLSFSYLERTE